MAVLLQGTDREMRKFGCEGVKASKKGRGHHWVIGQGLVAALYQKAATWLQEEKEHAWGPVVQDMPIPRDRQLSFVTQARTQKELKAVWILTIFP